MPKIKKKTKADISAAFSDDVAYRNYRNQTILSTIKRPKPSTSVEARNSKLVLRMPALRPWDFSAGPIIGCSSWDPSAPKAYLNYILLDANFTLVDFGFNQVTTSSAEDMTPPCTPYDYLNLNGSDYGARIYFFLCYFLLGKQKKVREELNGIRDILIRCYQWRAASGTLLCFYIDAYSA